MEGKKGIWRARWARIQRGWDLVFSGLLLVMGVTLFVALLPGLPDMIWNALTGDGEAVRTLFVGGAGVAVCVLQWRWRNAVYPHLRRDARGKRS